MVRIVLTVPVAELINDNLSAILLLMLDWLFNRKKREPVDPNDLEPHWQRDWPLAIHLPKGGHFERGKPSHYFNWSLHRDHVGPGGFYNVEGVMNVFPGRPKDGPLHPLLLPFMMMELFPPEARYLNVGVMLPAGGREWTVVQAILPSDGVRGNEPVRLFSCMTGMEGEPDLFVSLLCMHYHPEAPDLLERLKAMLGGADGEWDMRPWPESKV
ncbi:MAG: hypothetical protein H7A35_08085 [Planctomycetales bacterium]|nr:hypothetical protein [bacterium]UNM10013.1 MAG: hypothetical protein H7A35_08085 [Planctomycetales bacterium]